MVSMLLIKCLFFLGVLSCFGQTATCSYYVSLRGMGQPKYKEKFTHFSYANPSAPKGGHLNIYTPTRFNTLHSYAEMGLPAPYLDLVYATLMKVPRDNLEAAYPYLAESVTVDPSHTFVVFKVRKDGRFHNGEPIQAEDVVFSFELLKKEGLLSFRSLFQAIKEVNILDGHTVKFVFQSPNRDLPYRLAIMPIFSKNSLVGKDWKKETHLIGSGPYKIQSYDFGKFITYERVMNWWGEKLPSHKGFYNFDTFKVTYYAESRVGFEAFKKGLIDWWRDERISNWYKGYDFDSCRQGEVKRISFSKPYYHGLTGFFMNTRRPYLADIRVRKALSLLFDFDWLNKSRFFDSYKRNTSIFMNSGYGAPQKMSVREKKLADSYRANLLKTLGNPEHSLQIKSDRDRFSKAMSLFESAGWVLQNGTLISQKTGQPMVLDLVIFSSGQVPIVQHFIGN